ncbi:hypothetical protein [Micromonospora wenchangensis]|nr:hypothetical protein [Micromonospora wenchangensis]
MVVPISTDRRSRGNRRATASSSPGVTLRCWQPAASTACASSSLRIH